MNSKTETAVVQYNYPEITIVSCLKTLTQDSFFKYEIRQEIGVQRKNQIVLDNVVYVPQYLYLFRESCVIENERMVVSPGAKSSDPLLFIIPLQSSWFVSKTELDPLFSGPVGGGGGMTFPTIHLENIIANNQPCSVAGNQVILSVPISVPFVFPPNMAKMNFLKETRPGIILQKQPSTTTKIIEGLTNNKCTASDPSGADIAEIAMVPVDGDALTGIYTASMTRMLNDFFLFICAVAFSYFFVARAYVYLVIGGVDAIVKPGNQGDDTKQKYNVFNLFNIALIVSSVLLCFGLVYQANHGPNGDVNTDELTIGIIFFIVFGISLSIITMEISLKTKDYPFLSEGWSGYKKFKSPLEYVSSISPYDKVRKLFYGILGATMGVCAIILTTFNVVPNKTLNDLVIDWHNIGFLLGTICLGSCGIFATICTLAITILRTGIINTGNDIGRGIGYFMAAAAQTGDLFGRVAVNYN
jgi:hypothetical protein